MSVAGYLGPKPEVATPETRKRLQEDSAKAMKMGRLDGEDLPGAVKRAGHEDRFHKSVEEYDAVLRSHCRLL